MLIIRDAHERVMHHGIETTLSCVRAKFWIAKGRKTAKNVLYKCVICKKISERTMLPPPTPDLPDYRVNVSVFSFQAVVLLQKGAYLIVLLVTILKHLNLLKLRSFV